MTAQNFTPKSTGIKALFDLIYEIKFSRHVPLTVILLSAVYTVFRSQHYFTQAFKLGWYIAIPTALFIELLVLGASAITFIALRSEYVAELKSQDTQGARVGVIMSFVALAVAFVALLGVAWADAWLITQDVFASLLMVLVQFTQSLFILSFINIALLEERENLRNELKDWETRRALACPYCEATVSLNNRKRHIDACPRNPKNAT